MESDADISKIVIAVISFILGAILTRFTMSKKERLDVSMKKQELSLSLEDKLANSYQGYIDALAKFNNKVEVTFDDFIEIEKASAIYFNDLNGLACAVLSKNADKLSSKNSHVQKIIEGYHRTIPAHYRTLSLIAERCDFEYKGKFKKENYKSLSEVANKFA